MAKDAAAFANEFSPVFQKAARAATEERERIKQQITTLEAQRNALSEQIDGLWKELEAIDDRIVVGLKEAARAAGVKLELSNGKSKTVSKDGSKSMSSAEAVAAADAVYGALPPKSGKTFTSQADLAAKIGMDGAVVQKALGKLKRDGRAKSNGKRGRQGGWQRAT
jgi:hypothetical protein